ncbi:GAF domain-containing protein [Sinomonas atrocyanea]
MARAVGFRLFTVLAFRKDGQEMERIHSSRPAEYPVGGRKQVGTDVAADWLQASLEEQVPFFGKSRADVDRIFKDAELIASLGCGSIINVPVIAAGKTVAVLNVLDAEGAYTDDDVDTVQTIARHGAQAIIAAAKE